jgi:hypothetical protein
LNPNVYDSKPIATSNMKRDAWNVLRIAYCVLRKFL